MNPNLRNSNDLDASPTSPPLPVCLLPRPQNSPIGSEGNRLQIQKVCIRNCLLLIKLVGNSFLTAVPEAATGVDLGADLAQQGYRSRFFETVGVMR